MSDYVGQLERALSDAATREYGSSARSRVSRREMALRARDASFRARHGRWRSPHRWPGFAVAGVVLALAASAAAAVVGLVDRGSAPLTGTVPGLSVLHYDVPVTPDLEAGFAGWCSYPRIAISSVPPPASGAGTCAPSYSPAAPIVLAGGEPISNAEDLLKASHTHVTERQGATNLFWAIVPSRVAALRVGPGYVVAARRDDRLPPGWKAVIAFVSGQVHPVALDSSGRVIPEVGTAPQLTRAATHAYEPGSSAASSPCSIRIPRLPNVTATWGVVAARVPTLGTAVEANVLFSCARSLVLDQGLQRGPLSRDPAWRTKPHESGTRPARLNSDDTSGGLPRGRRSGRADPRPTRWTRMARRPRTIHFDRCTPTERVTRSRRGRNRIGSLIGLPSPNTCPNACARCAGFRDGLGARSP